MIHGGLGEVTVGGRRNPIGQHVARQVLVLPFRLLAVDELCLGRLVCAGNFDLANIGVNLLSLRVNPHCLWRTREERGEFPKLLARPLGKGMFVTLSAFQLNAQEYARHGGGQIFRFVFIDCIEGAGITARAWVVHVVWSDAKRDQLVDDLVIADVLFKTLAKPGLELRRQELKLLLNVVAEHSRTKYGGEVLRESLIWVLSLPESLPVDVAIHPAPIIAIRRLIAEIDV